MNNDSKETGTISAAFPYLMVLFAFFLIGFLFLTINIPLLFDLIKSYSHQSFGELFTSINQRYINILFPSITQADQATTGNKGVITTGFVLLYFLFSFIIGFIIQQISGSISLVLSTIVTKIMRLFSNSKNEYRFFHSGKFVSNDLGNFKVWLLQNKYYKLEWEWELINYYIYWGLSTNILTFSILSIILVKPFNILFTFILLILCSFSFAHSLMRSRNMQIVHDNYFNEFLKASNSKRRYH